MLNKQIIKELKKEGLTIFSYYLLYYFCKYHSQKKTVALFLVKAELGDFFSITQSTLSRGIRGLVDAGYIYKENNGKHKKVGLTSKGYVAKKMFGIKNIIEKRTNYTIIKNQLKEVGIDFVTRPFFYSRGGKYITYSFGVEAVIDVIKRMHKKYDVKYIMNEDNWIKVYNEVVRGA